MDNKKCLMSMSRQPEGESTEPGFTILNKKSLAYYEGLKEKGEPVYIDTIPYEGFMLLGQVDMEKRFTDLDEQEQRNRLNEELVTELEYAFDMGDEMTDSPEESMGVMKSLVTGEQGKEDSISYRLFHWKFSVEQKEEVKRAGCPCAKGSHTILFLSGNFGCADDGDTQAV